MESVDFKSKSLRKVTITPELAASWLEHRNKSNVRNISKSHAESIAKIISEGNWQPDHPMPISFRPDGNLLDGQNRLTAVVIANRPITATVYTCCPDSTSAYIDTGWTRRMNVRVQLVDDPIENLHTIEVINVAARMNLRSNNKKSPQEITTCFARNSTGFVFGAAVMRTGGRTYRPGVTVATVGAALAEYFAIDPAKATAFKIALLADSTANENAQYLRNKLQGRKHSPEERYKWAVYAMFAHLQGENIAGKYFRSTPDWGDYQPMIDTFYVTGKPT